MTATEKIPKAMAEKFDAITALTDAFCTKHLNDEYRQMLRKAVGALARKRPSPLLKGRDNTWAAGVVHAVGWCNFLHDATQSPHCKPADISEFFGVAKSTCQGKSSEIRDMLNIGYSTHTWILPSRLEHAPMVWMIQVNGFIIDARSMPIDVQRQAFNKGLIPYVPADRT